MRAPPSGAAQIAVWKGNPLANETAAPSLSLKCLTCVKTDGGLTGAWVDRWPRVELPTSKTSEQTRTPRTRTCRLPNNILGHLIGTRQIPGGCCSASQLGPCRVPRPRLLGADSSHAKPP